MFKWLRRWKRYPTAEISNNKHLEQAMENTPIAFVTEQQPLSRVDWSILMVIDDSVYWGKDKNGWVPQRHFYKTSKTGIEAAFLSLSTAQKSPWETYFKTLLSAYFDRFDGQLIRLQACAMSAVEITTEGHYNCRCAVQVEAQSTGLNAPVEEQQRYFELVLSGTTFEELALKELR